jgi:hypothetical protein
MNSVNFNFSEFSVTSAEGVQMLPKKYPEILPKKLYFSPLPVYPLCNISFIFHDKRTKIIYMLGDDL